MSEARTVGIVGSVIVAVAGGVLTAIIVGEGRFACQQKAAGEARAVGREPPEVTAATPPAPLPTVAPTVQPPPVPPAPQIVASAVAREQCAQEGDCGDLRCFRGVCGVEETTAKCANYCLLHTDTVDSRSSTIAGCEVPPGTPIVVLVRGPNGANWPVWLPTPPPGCPQQAYMHPGKMNVLRGAE
jgi:hypothetical protein